MKKEGEGRRGKQRYGQIEREQDREKSHEDRKRKREEKKARKRERKRKKRKRGSIVGVGGRGGNIERKRRKWIRKGEDKRKKE